MSRHKRNLGINVLEAARARIKQAFDHFENIYVSFSGGKDSSVMLHLVMDEAIARGRKVGVLIIDLEAQYKHTIAHIERMVDHYRDNIDLHWVCLPISLRNAVSMFQPKWKCWDPSCKKDWVREFPAIDGVVKDCSVYPFFEDGMEFEEFMVLFGEWYGGNSPTAGFVGIRCDESLNRFRTIASSSKQCFNGHKYTTRVNPDGELYNFYPLYDWKTQDIWRYHAKYPDRDHNEIYDLMNKAGVSIHQARLCQPYGDDQRRGLWLYHVLEPESWFKLVNRVNGANSGALYIEESGSITGYNKITKPPGHTWESFCRSLLSTLPPASQARYVDKFRKFLIWWRDRGYVDGIPDAAPYDLENGKLAPSWRRLCKCILRNDYWCKGLGFCQPKSEAYAKFMKMKKAKANRIDND